MWQLNKREIFRGGDYYNAQTTTIRAAETLSPVSRNIPVADNEAALLPVMENAPLPPSSDISTGTAAVIESAPPDIVVSAIDEPKKDPSAIAQIISDRLASVIGKDKRFPNQAAFDNALVRLYEKYAALDTSFGPCHGGYATLGDIDNNGLSPKQAFIVAVMLETPEPELPAFLRTAQDHFKTIVSTNVLSSYPQPSFSTEQVSHSLEKLLKISAKVPKVRPHVEDKIVHNETPTATSIVINDIIEVIPPQKNPIQTPEHHKSTPVQASFASNGYVEVKFPENKKGEDLLLYARTEMNWSFGTLLKKMHALSGGSQNLFAQSLGLDRAQYAKLANDAAKSPPLALMDNLAEKLGAAPESDKTEWHKFMLGIPYDTNQSRLNTCLEDGSIDTNSYGIGRPIALAKFFKILTDCHGVATRTELAQAIAQKNGITDSKSLRLAIDNMAGPQENAEKDTTAWTEDALNAPDRRAKRMQKELAQMVAEFAYPQDAQYQEACVDFLTSAKYIVPEDVSSARRSEALTNVRAERGSNWGVRTKKPLNPPTNQVS